MKIAVIGYNPPELRDDSYASVKSVAITNIIERFLGDYTDVTCVTGLNPGIDFIFSWIAVDNNLPLCIVIPYSNIQQGYSNFNTQLFNEVSRYHKAETIVFSKGSDHDSRLRYRDRYIIDKSDVIIAIGNDLNTKSAVGYGRFIKKEILTVNEEDVLSKIK